MKASCVVLTRNSEASSRVVSWTFGRHRTRSGGAHLSEVPAQYDARGQPGTRAENHDIRWGGGKKQRVRHVWCYYTLRKESPFVLL